MYKKIMILLVMLALLMGTTVFAEGEDWLTDESTEAIFEDVNEGDWFYEPVMTMNRYGIISGYPDGTFKPDESVLREQFAVMMVLALKLDIKEPSSSFADVADGYWASSWIETAKSYLTGWIRNGEYIFKPKENAVREDMAVALVRALDKPVDESMLSALDEFEDADEISDNLRTYMASAVYHNLMSGYEIEGKKYLKPMSTLSRAEAAALLMAVIQEEKIVFDEEKVVLNEGDFALTAEMIDGGVVLNWAYNTPDEVSGYKVVASKADTTPMYPENGYAVYTQSSTHTIYNYDSYNSGDLSQYEPGETYYMSITALVGDEKFSSNVLEITMPGAVQVDGKEPVLEATSTENGFQLKWSEIDRTGLQGYKIVASKEDSTPMYPDNGYAKWITELNNRSNVIKVGTYYSGGDLDGMFKAGETYYVAITAIYDSGKFSSNVLELTMPGELETPVTIEQKTPVVNAVAKDGYIEVTWSEISTSQLNGYKIVASLTDETPAYPENGYAYWITDLNVHKKELYNGINYNGGDFSNFESGKTYYISVTAVYSDMKVSGNTLRVTMP